MRGTCVLDPYARKSGGYRIRSLYLDSENLSLYHANLAELPDRFKARVRTYIDRPSPVFLEVKRRVKDVIVKSRALSSSTEWRQHLALASSSGWAQSQFATRVYQYGLRPKILVDYQRVAWMSRVDAYARVSVDRCIAAQSCHRWTLQSTNPTWRRLDLAENTGTRDSRAVLELKFSGAPPRWMVQLVQSMQLQRRAYSKYGLGIAACRGPASSTRVIPAGL